MYMKKIIGVLLIVTFLLMGCSYNEPQEKQENEKKQCKIELYSAPDNKLLQTIDNQDTVNKLLNTSDWEILVSISDNLIPEYIMLVYQEETLLYGQDPDEERDYELIATLITYQNSSYIKEIISSAVIKNMIIPENALTFYYVMPDDIQEDLRELILENK